MWFSLLECCPGHQKVGGSIPSQGTYLGCRFDLLLGHVWEVADVSFSHGCFSLSLSPSLPLSLKSINILREKKKKKGGIDLSKEMHAEGEGRHLTNDS